jgi:hypothetical protein
MEGASRSDGKAFACIGSDGQSYSLMIVNCDKDGVSLVLNDGTKVIRLAQGSYRVAGKTLYLWCSQPDAP